MKTHLQVADELCAEIESLSVELRAASTHFHLFIALRDSVPEFVTELGRAPLFWSFTRHAHLQAAAISLCRIYDQHQSSSNFSHLLESVQSNLPIFDAAQFWERNKNDLWKLSFMDNVQRPGVEELKLDIEFCGDRNPLVATLKNWRNNSIAHTNRRVVLGIATFLENDPLTYEAIRKLIDEGYRILNFYSIRFQGKEFDSYPQNQLNDYRRVLRVLKNVSPEDDTPTDHNE